VKRSPGLSDRLRDVATPWELACFAWVPLIVVGFTAWYELHNERTLGDLPIFRAASTAVLHGHSPYPAPTADALANFDTFVYPPAAAFLFAPFAVVPHAAAEVMMVAASIGAILGALRLLRVRDWRCYGVAAMSAPVANSLALGSFSLFLLVGAAATWALRDRATGSGVAAAGTATVKLLLWPLGLWLVVTRRRRATAAFAAATVVLVLVGWAAIGFAGFGDYPARLRLLTDLEAHRSFSVVALLGASGRTATAVSLILAIVVVLGVVLAARGDDGDRRAFAVAVLGALVATPVVWMHYYVLLFVPIALYRPRLSPLWLTPLVLWLAPSSYSEGVLWRVALGVGLVGLVAVRTAGTTVARTVSMYDRFADTSLPAGEGGRTLA